MGERRALAPTAPHLLVGDLPPRVGAVLRGTMSPGDSVSRLHPAYRRRRRAQDRSHTCNGGRMKIAAGLLAMGLATPAAGAEPQAPQLQLRPKAALAAAPSHDAAPFVSHPGGEPEIEGLPRR